MVTGKKSDEREPEQDSGLLPPPELRKSKVRKSEALWLMSFSDLSFVLLCFFVLLLTFSDNSGSKFEKVAEAMAAKAPKRSDQKSEVTLEQLSKQMQHIINERKLQKAAQIVYDTEGVVIEFKDAMLFRSGSAASNPQYEKTVADVMGVIAATPNRYRIVIEGHTDDAPIRSKRYKSNWDLSAARGIAMLRRFRARGVPDERLAVEAYAHTRPKIAYKGVKDLNKLRRIRAANRRVVVRIQ